VIMATSTKAGKKGTGNPWRSIWAEHRRIATGPGTAS
jgi:hypothetical protein